jgi:hypothetical protein
MEIILIIIAQREKKHANYYNNYMDAFFVKEETKIKKPSKDKNCIVNLLSFSRSSINHKFV